MNRVRNANKLIVAMDCRMLDQVFAIHAKNVNSSTRGILTNLKNLKNKRLTTFDNYTVHGFSYLQLVVYMTLLVTSSTVCPSLLFFQTT